MKSLKKRYLTQQIKSDLERKMVFVGGPRQVGKTTLAKTFLDKSESGYLNWDVDEHRNRILRKKFSTNKIWVFDEIHKFRNWRNYLKGIYDSNISKNKILVTGSARLDYYRFGGDSLQGRYNYLRLHPLSVKELNIKSQEDYERLLQFGGFPEPFFSGSESFTRRWSRENRQRLIKEDLISVEQTQDLGRLELLSIRLPELVGSPLSINSLREDLCIAHKTAAKWIDILERLYHIFRVYPFGAPTIRAVKKEAKHYHFNWAVIPDESFRFENLIGSHLLKWCHFIEDVEGFDMELRYFRDSDAREVDFVILKERIPLLFVECKFSSTKVSKSLVYLKSKFSNVRAIQVVSNLQEGYITKAGIEVLPAIHFLKEFV